MRRIIAIIVVALLSQSCGNTPSTPPTITAFTTVTQVGSGFEYAVYRLASNGVEDRYIGTVVRNGTQFEFPSEVTRGIASSGGNVTYVMKAYATGAAGTNGDFYYEAPLMDTQPVLNGPATALWWAMKYSAVAASRRVALSTINFENALFLINAACPSCLNKAASNTYRLLMSNGSLRAAINNLQNSTLLNATVVNTAPVKLIRSKPMALNGSVNLNAAQGDTANFEVVYYDPLQSDTRSAPDSWAFVVPSVIEIPITADSGAPHKATYQFPYDYQNNVVVVARKTIRSQFVDTNFYISLAITFRPPVVSIPHQVYQANHMKRLNLALYATDPNGGALTFALLEGPSGATLSGTTLSWNPMQFPDSQVGDTYFKIQTASSTGLSTTTTFDATVLVDHYPIFLANPSGVITIPEGTTHDFDFITTDEDADPIEVACRSATTGMGCDTFLTSGNPDGSAVPVGSNWPLTTKAANPGFYSGSLGFENASIPFMPGYWQMVAVANVAHTVFFTVNYLLGTTPELRLIPNPTQVSASISMTNVADPPTWTVQPGPAANPAGTENIAIAPIAGGSATDAAMNPGVQSVSYSLDTVPSGCSWINVDPTTAQITGTPVYETAASCSIRLRATDPLGIYALSNAITLNIDDIPHPLVATGSIPEVVATEQSAVLVDFSPYFTSVDLTVADPRQTLTMTCTNCVANGVTGVTFTGPTGTGTGTYFKYTPDYTMATGGIDTVIAGLTVQATLSNGNVVQDRTATQNFDLRIHDLMAAMALSLSNLSLTITPVSGVDNVTLTAATSGTIQLNVANLPGDTSSYPYTLATSHGMAVLSSTSGTGVATYTITLSPSYSDGYGGSGATATSKKNTMTVTLTGPLGSGISVQKTFAVNVTTVDRAATGFTIGGTAGTAPLSISINGSAFSDNSQTLAVISPDNANNQYTYSFDTSTYPSFGTISSGTWKFNPLSSGCAPGSTTVNKTVQIRGVNMRGTIAIVRTLNIAISNTTLAGGGGCPY